MSLPRSVQKFIDEMLKELPDNIRMQILTGEVRPVREVIRRHFGEDLEREVLYAFLDCLVADEERRGHGFMLWSCGGVIVGMISMKTINEAMARLRSIGKVSKSEEGFECQDQNIGMFIENMFVEIRAAGSKVKIKIDPEQLLKHKCGRLYTPGDWDGLPHKNVKMESVLGKTVLLKSRMCGCGEYASYSALELMDVGDVCNAKITAGVN